MIFPIQRLWRRVRFAVPVVMLLVLVVPAMSYAAVFNPETATLSNGMKVVLVENHRAPVVTQMVWYKVGAADEVPGKSGIAHFLEHLMFKGTKDIKPGQFSKIVARNGGQDNAFTSWDYTAFFQDIARDRLPLMMKMEADRMQNLQLSDKVVLPERDVIVEERRMRIDNNPSALLGEQMRNALFMQHPYGRSVIGWEHEMKHLTTQDALAFYHKWYAPNNAILVVVGDITMKELMPLAEKYYGAIPARKVPERHRVTEPVQHAPRTVTLTDDRVGQSSLSRYYLAPSYNTPDAKEAAPLEVFDEIMGSGTTSRLYQSLVVKQKLATDAGSFYNPVMVDRAIFGFYAVPRDGVSLQKLETALDEELAKIRKDGVTKDELENAKRKLTDSAVFARASFDGAARTLGESLAVGLSVDQVENWPERIAKVDVDAVNQAAKDVLDPKRSVTGFLKRPANAKGPARPMAPVTNSTEMR